ncbi:MAG: cupin domain-containing protein [Patescibacteria group bacterium]|jgi:quercetin dioxygenase-like cupin family protein
MNISKIEVVKSDKRGVILNCGKSNFIARRKGSVSADHSHKENEIIYLVKGEIELTIANKTQTVKSPSMFVISPDVYHKLIALTDIELIIDRS